MIVLHFEDQVARIVEQPASTVPPGNPDVSALVPGTATAGVAVRGRSRASASRSASPETMEVPS